MYIYKITTYSHEEHSELMLSSPEVLTQKELNQKFLRVMFKSAKRLDDLGKRKIKRSYRNFSCLFDEISNEDLLEEGLTKLVPQITSCLNAWSNESEYNDVDYLSPGDITQLLANEIKAFGIHHYAAYEEDDFGSYEEDIDEEELELHGS